MIFAYLDSDVGGAVQTLDRLGGEPPGLGHAAGKQQIDNARRRGSALLQQPPPQRLVGIGAGPASVFETGVFRVLRAAAEFAQRLDGRARSLNGHIRIQRAMKGPDRQVSDIRHERLAADAADGNGRGEDIGPRHDELPRGESAHGEPRDIDAVAVRSVFLQHGIENGPNGDRVVAPEPQRPSLRHDGDERELLRATGDVTRQANGRLFHAIDAALAAAVEKQNDRPLVVGISVVLRGDVERVLSFDAFAELDRLGQERLGETRGRLAAGRRLSRGPGDEEQRQSDGREGDEASEI